jgi:hypothetical protein
MEHLIARFTKTLAESIFVKDRIGVERAFKTAHGTYGVEIAWSDEDVSTRMFMPGSRTPSYGISGLNISVSHPETEPYPEGHDECVSYIQTRLEAYRNAAVVVTNRLIRYCKFMLGNPLLQEITLQQLINSNTGWLDENSNPLQRAIVYFEMPGVSRLHDYLTFV